MSYIDVFIPLAIGMLSFFSPETLIPAKDPAPERKKRILKICGLVLIGVSILYFIIKQFGLG